MTYKGCVGIDDVLDLSNSKSMAQIIAEEYDRMLSKDIVEVIKKYFPHTTIDEKRVLELARMIITEEMKGGE